jgi:phospholipid/cholesterol/gamma-HCH transport system substrate-binding protein
MRLLSRSFGERNPVPIGAAGLAVIAVLLVGAFDLQNLPFINQRVGYAAAVAEAGGLMPGDDVRVAGVRVGDVTGLDLENGHVRVDFEVDRGVAFGPATTASVRIRTLLGRKFLMLVPAGPGQLAAGSEIPLDRTTPAYDVVDAFSDLTTTEERIDTTRLAQALDTVATTFRNSPAPVRDALSGLSRLSRTIASRDAQLQSLLQHARGVSGVLASRDAQLTQLLGDGNALLDELKARRQAIHDLLVGTSQLSRQLSGVVADNRAQLAPALASLGSVLATLQANQASLDKAIAAYPAFLTVFADTLGSGPWFDTYIPDLVPVPGGPKTGGGTP